MSSTYQKLNVDNIISNHIDDLADLVSKTKWKLIETNYCINRLEGDVKEFSENSVHDLLPDLEMIEELSKTLLNNTYRLLNKCEE